MKRVAVIVVSAIAGFFLLILALAIFLPYCLTTHLRERQDQARESLRELYNAEVVHHNATGCYTANLLSLGAIGPAPQGYEREVIAADCNGFVARTWANLDNDPALDVWEVTGTSPEPVCISDDTRERDGPIDPRALP